MCLRVCLHVLIYGFWIADCKPHGKTTTVHLRVPSWLRLALGVLIGLYIHVESHMGCFDLFKKVLRQCAGFSFLTAFEGRGDSPWPCAMSTTATAADSRQEAYHRQLGYSNFQFTKALGCAWRLLGFWLLASGCCGYHT